MILSFTLTCIMTYFVCRKELVAGPEIEHVLDFFATSIILIGTIEIGLGVLLSDGEEQRLSSQEITVADIGTMLVRASRSCKSGMYIVSLGTFLLVLKILYSTLSG